MHSPSSFDFSVFLRSFSICILLSTATALAAAKPDFDKCYTDFIKIQKETGAYNGNTSIIFQGDTYRHHKPSPTERSFLLSTEGCETLCGSGVQYYAWNQIAGTITTWVLPIVGTLLQAPYEGNQFRKTLYASVRWIGSPIASLSYILWNIKVTRKCALLSDMSTSYNINLERLREMNAEGAANMLDMRDSLYILSVMNQYTVKSPIDPEQVESLLRLALFADITTPTFNLKERRRKLAVTLRGGRKRGIVPVFVTLMWFLISLAISIQSAFTTLGQNSTAHDLALGLLLAWFPVLILSSIVDRNPVETDTARKKLNKLLGAVQVALRIDGVAETLIQNVRGNPSPANNQDNVAEYPVDWFGSIRAQVSFDREIRTSLAESRSQDFREDPSHINIQNTSEYSLDRISSHRPLVSSDQERPLASGVSDGSTDGLAESPIQTNRGRDPNHVYHQNHPLGFNLDWVGSQRSRITFDQEIPPPLASGLFVDFAGQGRVRWHYGVAHPILTGMEAIILAKCNKSARNWLQIPDIQKQLVCGRRKQVLLLHFDLREFWEIFSAFIIVVGTISGAFVLSFRTPTVGLGCHAGGYTVFGTLAAGMFTMELVVWYFIVAPRKKALNRIGQQIPDQSRKASENLITSLNWGFRLCELASTAWLIYIVMAQTIGSYQTCECQSANWGHEGGYIDANIALNADRGIVQRWWITGVALSIVIMFVAIAFLVVEWCEQSHLNSVDLNKAMHGLNVTQHFKYGTTKIRRPPDYFIYLGKRMWRTLSDSWWNKETMKEKGRESIRWSKN
ncbi:hypothetical protein MMC07_000252 [Pseudocyphellaria aurata]|nr:hypothetical protein [Pseudocyphellaria aurata]